MNLTDMLTWAKRTLTPVSDNPLLEANILLAHTLGAPRTLFLSDPKKNLEPKTVEQFKNLIEKRLAGMPVAYITGEKEFWSLPLKVTEDTLIPRPETECLVEQILKKYPGDEKKTVVDLGTGSGAVALALAKERPTWKILATDNSIKALMIAKENATLLKLSIEFRCGSWFVPLEGELFDVILSNPPYISQNDFQTLARELTYEPESALISKDDGLADLLFLIRHAPRFLKKGGALFLEHGKGQGAFLLKEMQKIGYRDCVDYPDYAGIDRVLVGKM